MSLEQYLTFVCLFVEFRTITQSYEGNFMLSAMWCFELNQHDNQEANVQKSHMQQAAESRIITRGATVTY